MLIITLYIIFQKSVDDLFNTIANISDSVSIKPTTVNNVEAGASSLVDSSTGSPSQRPSVPSGKFYYLYVVHLSSSSVVSTQHSLLLLLFL